jgi:hypothetical protein
MIHVQEQPHFAIYPLELASVVLIHAELGKLAVQDRAFRALVHQFVKGLPLFVMFLLVLEFANAQILHAVPARCVTAREPVCQLLAIQLATPQGPHPIAIPLQVWEYVLVIAYRVRIPPIHSVITR